jgi:uncharacterized protein YlbG (UPF0298 family)
MLTKNLASEHFPTTRIAIIGIDYFAISRDCSELQNARWILAYLFLLYVEKKRRYKLLNMDNATAKLVMRQLHKFHHSERFKVRNSL